LPVQQTLIRSLNRSYPFVRIVILAFQYPYTNQEYQWHGNQVIPFNGKNRGKFHRVIVWFKVWKALKGLEKKENIRGILNFWLGECAMIGHYFAKRKRLPHFSWIFGQDALKGNKYVKLLKPHPNELIALSDFIVHEFSKNYGIIPAHVIPLGIDPELFGKRKMERNIDILAAGSLIPLKRFDIFIDVVKVLQKKYPDLKAVLCGDGCERKNIEAMIAAAGLERTITLTGEKPHTEVLALMQQCKVFLHPSSYEGFGVVCLEALYAGAHVISFCYPQDAWIRNWHRVNDIDSMVSLSQELLDNADIDHHPVMPYSITDTARSIMQLFDQSEDTTS
jgi:glycosyltransferase involved in cell wall biosynthesis